MKFIPRSRDVTLTHHHSLSTVVDPSLYFDTEATYHVVPYFQKLNLAEEYKGTDKLQVRNVNHFSISHIGSSFLYPNLKLPSVLIFPHITKHLIGIFKLTNDNNVCMELWPSHCFVKSFQGKTLLKGDVKHGFYRLPIIQNHSTFIMALTGVRTSLHGWHKRLAHPYAPFLRRLLSLFKLSTSSNNFLNVKPRLFIK